MTSIPCLIDAQFAAFPLSEGHLQTQVGHNLPLIKAKSLKAVSNPLL